MYLPSLSNYEMSGPETWRFRSKLKRRLRKVRGRSLCIRPYSSDFKPKGERDAAERKSQLDKQTTELNVLRKHADSLQASLTALLEADKTQLREASEQNSRLGRQACSQLYVENAEGTSIQL